MVVSAEQSRHRDVMELLQDTPDALLSGGLEGSDGETATPPPTSTGLGFDLGPGGPYQMPTLVQVWKQLRKWR
jgi:hypothetical protein